ncbi:FecR family protein [Hymenobacter sp. APR13]|uniref:FecR family protein n=1 Tax=Hymenobacter sp. APR13 TaxID=1356852 RepID=UPI0009E0B45B|nr:FecR domain-containing protein [Hymenobacter sp. APR13]
MEISELYDLIGKELAGELSEVEREVLHAWLAQATEEERLVYDEIRLFWQGPKPVANPADTARAFDRLLARIDEAEQPAPAGKPTPQATEADETGGRVVAMPRASRWRRLWLAAASMAVLATGGTVAYRQYAAAHTGAAPLSYEERTNPRGTKSKVLLADGTAVWLNADSHLWFPATFSGARREVYLEGEAFFDVKRNEQMPFIIHVGRHEVRVLGTSFNVKAYQDDDAVETAVVTGRVAFIRAALPAAAERDTIYVVPDQKVVYSKASHELRVEQVNGLDYAAWNQRSLIFQATPLAEVAKTLERQYNVTVRFEDERLRNCRLTGRFKDQSLREVLRLIEMTRAFDFELHNNSLLIKGLGCDSEAPERLTI